MTAFDLNTVDVDGAIRETEDAVAGDTRAAFFRKAAVGGGAVLTSGAIMGMLPEMSLAAPSKKQDLKILNYALTLEYLEAAFYKEAVDSGALSGLALDFAKIVNQDEQTHVTALRKTIKSLGGKAVASPNFDFQGTNKDQGKFLATAFVLENTGVRAYLGQAGRIKQGPILAAAASIVTVEARHAGAVAVLLNETPFSGEKSISPSGAFDRSSSMKTILKEVGATGFITE
jgi:rubrerythrin